MFERCWKPASTEELDVPGDKTITSTVADNEAVNTRDVEDHEVFEVGRVGTGVTGMMAELNDKARSSKS